MPDIMEPVLPLPTRLPNRDDLARALEVAKSFITPPDPYEAAGKAVEQYRAGHPLDAAETMYGAMPQTGAIIAYHGSPHKFDRFDSSKIGTGEGAQAYGHGLYFAQNEDVARQYRDDLSALRATYNGKPVESAIDTGNALRDAILLDMRQTGIHDAVNAADRLYNRGLSGTGPYCDWGELRAARDEVRNGLERIPYGHMYQVRINADPEHFLDWDKPLSGQSPVVQQALAKHDADMWSPSGNDYDPSELGQLAYSRLHSIVDANRPSLVPKYGEQAYFDDLGRLTSKELNSSGIPGIKYLDQGSRGPAFSFDVGAPRADFGPYSNFTNEAEANAHLDMLRRMGFDDAEMKRQEHPQSRNYVVFDDGLIDILKRYASGGEVSAPITGPHTITASDLIGVAAPPAQTMGAYTDAGGQQIAAPFVTSMANGYPVYALPSAPTTPASHQAAHHEWNPFGYDPATRALEIASAMNTGVQNG